MLAGSILRAPWNKRLGSLSRYSTAAEAKKPEASTLTKAEKSNAPRVRRATKRATQASKLKVLNPTMVEYFKHKPFFPKTKTSKTMAKLAPLIEDLTQHDVDETKLTNAQYIEEGLDKEVIAGAKIYEIVPTLIPSFKPRINLVVKHSDKVVVYRGIKYPSLSVRTKPTVTYEADEKKFYTLAMIDPDFPLRENPKQFWNHYLVVNIPGNRVAEGQVLADWVPPAPPADTGDHRYIWLLYEQKDHMHFRTPTNDQRILLDLPDFVSHHHLTPAGLCFHRTEFDKDVAELYHGWGQTGLEFKANSYAKKLTIKPQQYQGM